MNVENWKILIKALEYCRDNNLEYNTTSSWYHCPLGHYLKYTNQENPNEYKSCWKIIKDQFGLDIYDNEVALFRMVNVSNGTIHDAIKSAKQSLTHYEKEPIMSAMSRLTLKKQPARPYLTFTELDIKETFRANSGQLYVKIGTSVAFCFL